VIVWSVWDRRPADGCVPQDGVPLTVLGMAYRRQDPIWVRGERMRIAAEVVEDRGTTIRVLILQSKQEDTVAATAVEPRDPKHPIRL